MLHDKPIFSANDFKTDVVEPFYIGVENRQHKVKLVREWQQLIASKQIYAKKEEELQTPFLHTFFGEILGYPYQEHLPTTQIRVEVKTEQDQTKADGALGFFVYDANTQSIQSEVKAVIELKDAHTDLDKPQRRKDFKGSPVEQAFAYVPKFGGSCQWVIVSNFVEIRLYHASDSIRYEEFLITELFEENPIHKISNFKKLLFLLQKDRLFLQNSDSPTDILFADRRAAEISITQEFYNNYRQHRENLFRHIQVQNPQENAFEVLSATQKIMDRLVFMCFVRDTVPMIDVLRDSLQSLTFRHSHKDTKLWEILQELFVSFDKGYSPSHVPDFNGGLFKADDLIDRLVVRDSHIVPFVEFLLQHDFLSELNVSILGHIFEQSITDLEELRTEIAKLELNAQGGATDTQLSTVFDNLSKRKKDGIFYTPNYITQYILNKTIGEWLEEKKQALLLEHGEENAAYWRAYEQVLRKMTVLDPACGSGAFLTAVFEYVWAEWKIVVRAMVALGLRKELYRKEEWRLKKDIVLNNIFGVDLNRESVEISKLSLWLQTANAVEPLSDLTNNIKQGNSLIDDKNITPLAFDWAAEFPQVFENQGFDIVVGNPPYVRADLEDRQYQKERKWITAHYEFLYEKWDLMTAFYEQALKKLLKQGGSFAFISSNAINTSKYAEKLQKWMCENFDIRSIDYFENIEVFKGVGVIPTIISVKKAPPTNKVKKIYHKDDFEAITSEIIDLEGIVNRKAKIFRQVYEDIQLKTTTVLLNNICYISKGMVINADEVADKRAFGKDDILSLKKTNLHTLPIVEGKDLKRYEIERVKYLEWGTDRVPSKLSRPTFPDLYTGEKILRGMVTGGVYDNTGITCNHGVIVFKRFIDLKNVNERSITISISKNHLAEENNKSAADIAQKRQELEGISNNFDLKYILALINSKYAYWYLNNYRRHRLENYFYPDDFRNFPVPDIPLAAQKPFIEKVSILLAEGKKLQKLQQAWFTLMPAKIRPKRALTKKLESWYLLDFNSFLAEMQKVGIQLGKSYYKQRRQLQEDFEFAQPEAKAVYDILVQTDQEIDNLVYKLYNLSAKEIAQIEDGNTKL